MPIDKLSTLPKPSFWASNNAELIEDVVLSNSCKKFVALMGWHWVDWFGGGGLRLNKAASKASKFRGIASSESSKGESHLFVPIGA